MQIRWLFHWPNGGDLTRGFTSRIAGELVLHWDLYVPTKGLPATCFLFIFTDIVVFCWIAIGNVLVSARVHQFNITIKQDNNVRATYCWHLLNICIDYRLALSLNSIVYIMLQSHFVNNWTRDNKVICISRSKEIIRHFIFSCSQINSVTLQYYIVVGL